MQFRTAYDHVSKKGPYKSSLNFKDENGDHQKSMTQQCFKEECDINTVLKRADKTGLITHVNKATAQYGDFSEVNEYQQSLNMVKDAQTAFEALPASIRKKFGNDPGIFFEFATDPKNKDEMIELGLAHQPDVIEPTLVRVVADETVPE